MENPLSQMKVELSQELTATDCQTVATWEGFSPALREKMKDGLTLINTLEARGKFSKDNLGDLVTMLEKVSLTRAAGIVKEYQKRLESPERPPEPTFQPGPDLNTDHMKQEVPASKLAKVAEVMGVKGRMFAIAKLKLTTTEVETCEFNENHLPNVGFNYLKKWKDNKGMDATSGTLARFLHEYGFPREVWGILETPEEN